MSRLEDFDRVIDLPTGDRGEFRRGWMSSESWFLIDGNLNSEGRQVSTMVDGDMFLAREGEEGRYESYETPDGYISYRPIEGGDND